MIRVTLFKRDKGYIGFEVKGHARFADYGKDIVCASVSILTQNCINSLGDVLKAKVDFKQEDDGYARIYVLDKDEEILDKASLLIESMNHGLTWLSDTYPKYVTTTSKEV